MPKLTKLFDNESLKDVWFEDQLTIGRDPCNTIVLAHDEISRFHVLIFKEAQGRFIICDLFSLNGVRVGKVSIVCCVLNDGDVFEIGGHHFCFDLDSRGQAPAPQVRTSKKIITRARWGTTPTTLLAVCPPEREPCQENRHDPRQRLELMLTLGRQIVSVLDYEDVLAKALDLTMKAMGARRGFLALKTSDGKLVYSQVNGFPEPYDQMQVSRSLIDDVVGQGQPVLTENAVRQVGTQSVIEGRLQSILCVPLMARDQTIGCLYLDNPEKQACFNHQDLEFMGVLAQFAGVAIENARLVRAMRSDLKGLQESILHRHQMVFHSPGMKAVFSEIQKVASTSVAVLLRGETGTGKELVARALHARSARKGPFFSINCAAIPENLLESELFGHEKGAFSGAERTKPGLFELPTNGTLFLDEIGEMSPSLQPKILRAIQEKKIRRLGGTRDIDIDVRVISATNQDLNALIQAGTFRDDLYFRLAEYEIAIPPLRERPEDIPLLAAYFLYGFCKEQGVGVPRLSRKVTAAMMSYRWPGNVRELRSAIVQAVVRSSGKTIRPEDLKLGSPAANPDLRSLEDVEKAHIENVLKMMKGNKVAAAEKLGISRDTLYQKIAKYGIAV